jgi:hypothetical protein
VQAFDFAITFFSFIFALGLAHLLLAFAYMIRHRKDIRFSLPQAIWMLAAVVLLLANWVSLWDFHSFGTVALSSIVVGFVFSVNLYLICALVVPELGSDEWRDLREFHARQGKTYMAAFAIVEILSVAANFAAGSDMGVAKWTSENDLVLGMVPCALVPIFVRARAVQIGAALGFLGLIVAYLIVYYPQLK